MSNQVVCYVHIPYPREELDRVEAENPDVVDGIVTPAMKYITRHVRAARDGEVIEVDEYANWDDYHAFRAEAGPFTDRYNELLGEAPVTFEVYEILQDLSSEGDRWFTGEPLG